MSPDGCADILFTDGNLQVVGAMTRYQAVSVSTPFSDALRRSSLVHILGYTRLGESRTLSNEEKEQ